MDQTLATAVTGLWAGLPLVMWLFRFVGSRRIHGLALYLGTVGIGYLVYIGCAWATQVLLEQRMNRFDLDGDGGIGGAELTPMSQEARGDWASDSGRTLACITGLPVTAIWVALCLTPLGTGAWIVRRLVDR